MHNTRRLIASVTLCFVIAVPFSGLAVADSPIVIKFSHVVAPDTPKGRAAEKFKELAEKLTNGKVRVEVYPNSQLYKDKEELEALQLGAVQMLAPALSKFGPLGAKEFGIFDVPFIFKDYAAVRRITEGPIGKQLNQLLVSKGILGLAYWENGFSVVTSNKKILLPEDFRGQKIRIQSSKILDAEMRRLGAIPQIMAFSEVYQALQTRVIDGCETTPSNIYTQKFFEVQKYVIVSNHSFLIYDVIVNKKFWEGLPADIRSQLTEALQKATTFGNSEAENDNLKALEAMKASGKTEVVYLTPQQTEEWRKTLLPVREDVAPLIGKDLLDKAVATASGK